MSLDSDARKFAAVHPTHDGATWHLWCGSLMYRMCSSYGIVPVPIPSSANDACNAAGALNPDHRKAPIGAFHYWEIGDYGHVGLDTLGGGEHVFMASKYLAEELGDAIGFNSVPAYGRGIYPYKGWSMFYGKNGKITLPSYSLAVQTCIDKGLIDPNGDLNRTVDINTLCWFAYKLLKFLGKL